MFAKVTAINSKGESSESNAGTGAYMLTVPDSPVNLIENTSQRTVSSLGIQWTAGASDGGSPIIDY